MYQVQLRQRDHGAAHAKDVQDLEMLLALGFPPLVGRDHEEHQPNRTHAREHVRDEALVSGNIDEPDLPPARERAPRVPQVDGQAAALLLLPPVGVDAGEAGDERGLAVIHVSGGGDDAQSRSFVHVSPR